MLITTKVIAVSTKTKSDFIPVFDEEFSGSTLEGVQKEIDTAISLGTHSISYHLINSIIRSILKAFPVRLRKSDRKTISLATTEMILSFAALGKPGIPPIDMIFGPSRAKEGSPMYEQAVKFGYIRASKGSNIGTGGGPGVMDAAHKGCADAGGKAIGLCLKLPFEQETNPHILRSKGLEYIFKYFFTRKLSFVKYANSLTVIGGGFGTLDELFESITLMQCGKSPIVPIVLLEPENEKYWGGLLKWIDEVLGKYGFIVNEDKSLYYYTTSAQDASDYIDNFYSNFQKMEYKKNNVHIQIKYPLNSETIEKIKEKYTGTIDPESFSQEIDQKTGNAILSMTIIGKKYAHLKLMIDDLNAETPK